MVSISLLSLFSRFFIKFSSGSSPSFTYLEGNLSKEEIEELEVKNNEHPELREAHKALAKEIITFLHGEEEYDKAVKKVRNIMLPKPIK